MDGQYLTNRKDIKRSIEKWLFPIFTEKQSWRENNLHIDDISTLENIKRQEWIELSFTALKVLSEINFPESFIAFLHVDLMDVINKEFIDNITLNWLKNNLNEFTPPSFNCTTLDYYNDFYKKNLVECVSDDKIQKIIGVNSKIHFFYRTFYDISEKMFAREVYVFFLTTSPE